MLPPCLLEWKDFQQQYVFMLFLWLKSRLKGLLCCAMRLTKGAFIVFYVKVEHQMTFRKTLQKNVMLLTSFFIHTLGQNGKEGWEVIRCFCQCFSRWINHSGSSAELIITHLTVAAFCCASLKSDRSHHSTHHLGEECSFLWLKPLSNLHTTIIQSNLFEFLCCRNPWVWL